MDRTRISVTMDAGVLRAIKQLATRSGVTDEEVIEEALRRQLGLDLLDEMWSRAELSEEAATKLAVEAQHRTRPPQRP